MPLWPRGSQSRGLCSGCPLSAEAAGRKAELEGQPREGRRGKTLLFWFHFHFITQLVNLIVVKHVSIWKQTPTFIPFPSVFCLETRELPHQNPFMSWIWFGICNPPWGDNAVRGTWEDAPFSFGAAVGHQRPSPPIDPTASHRACLWPHTVMNSLKSLLEFFWCFISSHCHPAAKAALWERFSSRRGSFRPLCRNA